MTPEYKRYLKENDPIAYEDTFNDPLIMGTGGDDGNWFILLCIVALFVMFYVLAH